MGSWSERSDDLLRACLEEFAVRDPNGDPAVTYHPKGASPVAGLVAVFKQPGTTVEPGTRVPVQTTQPTLAVRRADLGKEIERGEEFDVLCPDGVLRRFKVDRSVPDGLHGLKLFLLRA